MKRAAIFILVLLISRIGLQANAATSNGISIGNFFLQPRTVTNSSLNQVLSLVVGPAGPKGEPGTPGISGINGQNGEIGPAGPAGAPPMCIARA